ncbi:uncharacterized protein LOC115236974 [Formica exsecta]|uniref:uncharacterized protein LOC115236974 n=1 Tax=Formica exsecta TaxID=72781 RepID=UPI0011425804|nr:uncharacterized protein LOC115236974 [Formica exsecta]
MVTTIQQALRPLFVTYFIMGLNSYPIKQPTSKIPWITCLSILYSLIIWSIYAYLYYYTVTLFTWKKLFLSTIYVIVVMINSSTTIVSVIMGFYHQEKFKICIKRLAAVNDTLEELGTPKAYRKMHMYSKQVIIGWIVYYVILNFYELLMCLYENQKITWILLRTCILNHCSHINTFVDFLFIFFLWYIGTGFDKVNEHMRYLLTNKKRTPNGKKLVIAFHRYVICTDDYKRILWTLMHLHLELCRITRELNSIFGTQMTFEMVFYITNITIICSSLNKLLMEYREELSLYQWFLISCGTMIFIVRLYVVHYICECVKVKKLKMCIKRLAAVNDTLEQLGTPKAYRKIYMCSKQKLKMCIKRLAAVNDTLEQLGTPKAYLGTRFDKVNEHMQYLLMNKKHIPNGNKPVVALHRHVICTDDYKRILWTLM